MSERRLTKELLEKIGANECIYSCSDCPLCAPKGPGSCRAGIAIILLAERAEREKNPGVWDGAPDDADTAYVAFGNSERGSPLFVDKRHTRILPKTKAREIAERYSCDTETCHPMIDGNRAVDVIESAILEALQSEGKK